MTYRPRMGGGSPDFEGRENAPTQPGYAYNDERTQRVGFGELANRQTEALAWSAEDPANRTAPVSREDPSNGEDPAPAPVPWFRATTTLIAAGVVAVALAGGGIAYTLTGFSSHSGPA